LSVLVLLAGQSWAGGRDFLRGETVGGQKRLSVLLISGSATRASSPKDRSPVGGNSRKASGAFSVVFLAYLKPRSGAKAGKRLPSRAGPRAGGFTRAVGGGTYRPRAQGGRLGPGRVVGSGAGAGSLMVARGFEGRDSRARPHTFLYSAWFNRQLCTNRHTRKRDGGGVQAGLIHRA